MCRHVIACETISTLPASLWTSYSCCDRSQSLTEHWYPYHSLVSNSIGRRISEYALNWIHSLPFHFLFSHDDCGVLTLVAQFALFQSRPCCVSLSNACDGHQRICISFPVTLVSHHERVLSTCLVRLRFPLFG